MLFHERERADDLAGYVVHHLAEAWREDGHDVLYLFGTRHFVPADAVFVHVNLSVVPESYLEFAARYPVAVNGRVADIRKSVTSKHIVRRGDGWNGPVVVKSDLNFGGQPERTLESGWLDRHSLTWRRARYAMERLRRVDRISSWHDYRVFDQASEVPDFWFDRTDAVVERFVPEFEDGLYHLRMYQFLGNRWRCARLASPHALIKADRSVKVEPIQPHPEVLAWRSELGLDYGKLDYVVHDGELVLLDVNKTTGATNYTDPEALRALRRDQAEGLYALLT